MLRVEVNAAPLVFWMPTNVPKLATAYLTQPRVAVPNALLLIVMVPVVAPVLAIPVNVWLVIEVAQPRRVLLLMFAVAPVVAQRMNTELLAPGGLVEVRTPLLLRMLGVGGLELGWRWARVFPSVPASVSVSVSVSRPR